MAKKQEERVGSKHHEFASPGRIAEVLKTQDHKDMAFISGALGAVAKGGKTVRSSEEDKKAAKEYQAIISGAKEGVLKSKDADHISRLVGSFLKPHHG